ncbi:MAG: hypothetical protein ACKOAZ_02375 [Ilumatobacteraceae bacterium]
MRCRALGAVVAVAVAAVVGAGCSTPGGSTDSTPGSDSSAGPPDSVRPSPSSTGGLALDEFCDGWDAYGATLLALTAGAESAGTAELEVVSAAALADAIEQIGARWPAELVGERSLVLSDVVGPYLRRAQKALDALDEAGASADDVRVLALAWRKARASRPGTSTGESPDPLAWLEALQVPADMRGLVDAAVDRFMARVPPFAADPTLPGRRALVQSDGAPRTEAFLSANCPGVGATVAALEF